MTRRRKRGKKSLPGLFFDASVQEIEYFESLLPHRRKKMKRRNRQCSGSSTAHVPIRFRILGSNLPDRVKHNLLQACSRGQDAMSKEMKRIEFMLSLPFGVTKMEFSSIQIQNQVLQASEILNRTIYGQQDAKNAILRHLGRKMLNPNYPCKPLALCGPPGVGKTRIAKDGIAAALSLPFSMLALGGASDAHVLNGHSFTYEGSTPGFIASMFAKHCTREMVILLDEVDKLGDRHSCELQSMLIHLTDPVQNDRFVDDYVGPDLPLDVSNVLWIMSLNDMSKMSPVLADRVEMITLQGYTNKEQKAICRDFMIPRIWDNQLHQTRPVAVDDDCLNALLKHANSTSGPCGMRKAEFVLTNLLTEVALARNIDCRDGHHFSYCNCQRVRCAYHDRITLDMLQLSKSKSDISEGVPPMSMYS